MAREKGLYKRKDSPYWWIDVVLPNGQRVCQSTRTKDLEQANELLVSFKAEAYRNSQLGIIKNVPWPHAVLRYLSENLDKKSIDTDRDHLRQLDPFLRDHLLRDINMSILWEFIEHRRTVDQVKNATINRALEVVRRILILAAEDWRWLDRAPKVRMLREPRGKVRFLTKPEAGTLLETLPGHLRPVVIFALSTGCRMQEILNLQWDRVDLGRQVAWLEHGTTKTGEGRGIPLNQDACAALIEVRDHHSDYCFTYRGHKMAKIGSAWKRSLSKAEIHNFRFHDLRHTWASWHVMAGTSLHELMELGGWKSYEMVLRYAHLAPEHLKLAASRVQL